MSQEVIHPLASSTPMPQICVPSIDEGAAWYRDVLGFEGEQVTDNAWTFKSGAGVFSVFQDPSMAPSPNSRMVWPVADIHAAVAWLRGRGVEVARYEGIPVDDDGVYAKTEDGPWACWFKDPWDNVMQLYQPPA